MKGSDLILIATLILLAVATSLKALAMLNLLVYLIVN